MNADFFKVSPSPSVSYLPTGINYIQLSPNGDDYPSMAFNDWYLSEQTLLITVRDAQGVLHTVTSVTKPANEDIATIPDVANLIQPYFNLPAGSAEISVVKLHVEVLNYNFHLDYYIGDSLVSPVPDGKTFLLQDLDDIHILAQEGNHTIQLSITDTGGQTHTLIETYTATDEGIVVIRDVAELLLPYFDLTENNSFSGFATNGLKRYSTTVQLNIAESDGANVIWQHHYSVTYSNVPTQYLHTNHEELVQRFLQRDSTNTVTADQPCSVSFWRGGPAQLTVKMLLSGTSFPSLVELQPIYPGSDRLCTYHFTLKYLCQQFINQYFLPLPLDVKNLIYADFQLFDIQGEAPVLRDSVRFMHDRGHRAYERTFAFIGPMGEPEYITMTGKEGREAEFEGTFLMEHNDYRKAATKLNKIHTSCTGPITEGGRDLVWDMAASPWVYTIEDGQLVEVTITEVELTDSSPHTEPVGLTVKWRYADEYRQRTFKRTPHTPHLGVFDEIFDETFE